MIDDKMREAFDKFFDAVTAGDPDNLLCPAKSFARGWQDACALKEDEYDEFVVLKSRAEAAEAKLAEYMAAETVEHQCLIYGEWRSCHADAYLRLPADQRRALVVKPEKAGE